MSDACRLVQEHKGLSLTHSLTHKQRRRQPLILVKRLSVWSAMFQCPDVSGVQEDCYSGLKKTNKKKNRNKNTHTHVHKDKWSKNSISSTHSLASASTPRSSTDAAVQSVWGLQSCSTYGRRPLDGAIGSSRALSAVSRKWEGAVLYVQLAFSE